jgi:phosphogluconate dehydratase
VLHALTVPQTAGHRVAPMGTCPVPPVPAAIHVCPEAACGGGLAKVQNGDVIRLDPEAGVLEVLVEPAENGRRARRRSLACPHTVSAWGANWPAKRRT